MALCATGRLDVVVPFGRMRPATRARLTMKPHARASGGSGTIPADASRTFSCKNSFACLPYVTKKLNANSAQLGTTALA